MRGAELALKGEVEKFREQRRTIPEDPQRKESRAPDTEGQNDGSSATLTSETIVVGWDELYRTTAEAPCCITAAEATPPEVPWTVAKDPVLPDRPTPVMWADAFTDVSSSPEVGKGFGIETDENPLNLQMGVNYILRYGPQNFPFISFRSY